MNGKRTSQQLRDLFAIATEEGVKAIDEQRAVDAYGHMAQAHGIALAATAIDMSLDEYQKWASHRDRAAQAILSIRDLIVAPVGEG
jgi:hypothetical protein